MVWMGDDEVVNVKVSVSVGKKCVVVVVGCVMVFVMVSVWVVVVDSLLDEVDVKVLCDAACEKRLES